MNDKESRKIKRGPPRANPERYRILHTENDLTPLTKVPTLGSKNQIIQAGIPDETRTIKRKGLMMGNVFSGEEINRLDFNKRTRGSGRR